MVRRKNLETIPGERAEKFLHNKDIIKLGLKPRGVMVTGVKGEIPSNLQVYVTKGNRLVKTKKLNGF